MKRFWIGLTVLTLLLIGGWVIKKQMDQVHLQISHTLQQASQAALAEDWPTARQLAAQAQDRWHRYHRLTAALADHTPMDELDALFAELAVFAQEQEQPHFSAICAHLATLAHSMAESHHISWWNFL